MNTVMLNSSLRQYRRAVDDVDRQMAYAKQMAEAQKTLNRETGAVVLGAKSYTEAVRHAVKAMMRDGLTGFTDAAGREWSAQAYVQMDIKTTAANAARNAAMQRNEDYGNALIMVSSHPGSRPGCEPWQARVYSTDGTSGTAHDLNGKAIPYIPLSATSYGQPAGLFGINCGHFPSPFVDGVSVLRYETYDHEETQRLYKESQQQRYMERRIRQAKAEADALEAAGDPAGAKAARKKAREMNTELKGWCEEKGRDYLPERTRIVRPGEVAARAENTDVQEHENTEPAADRTRDVSTEGLKAANLGEHETAIATMVGKADRKVREVWNKNAADLRVLEAHDPNDDAFCSGAKGITINIDSVARGNDYKAPYQTAFHEFGHQIDYLSGSNGHPFSYTYGNDLLARTACLESTAHIDRYFRKHFTHYYPNLTRQMILTADPRSRSIRALADDFDNGLIGINRVLQNKKVFDTLKIMMRKEIETDFCKTITKKYKDLRKLSPISDIFEPSTVVDYPFGTGHRGLDPAYWFTPGMHGTEIFAHMMETEIGNRAALRVIRKFYPKTYKVFREILGVIK